MGAGAYPTQPAASWDMAPAPTREIQQRWNQWVLAFVYVFCLFLCACLAVPFRYGQVNPAICISTIVYTCLVSHYILYASYILSVYVRYNIVYVNSRLT